MVDRVTSQSESRQTGVAVTGSFYHESVCLFSDLELNIAPDSWTCLLGPSGVGKSTLLRLIAGLDTGGDFQGSVRAHDGLAMDQRIAYMAQSDLLLSWLNVHDNVLLGAKLRGEKPDHDRAESLIARVGLSKHSQKRPSALSGGMRQRVALARALMEDRPYVLLDEPFAALDAKTRSEMQELAFEMLVGRTVLLVSHDPSEAARLGHHIFIMTDQNLRSMPVPNTNPIRAYDAPETLEAQIFLMHQLRNM